jgi:hypothetical protein
MGKPPVLSQALRTLKARHVCQRLVLCSLFAAALLLAGCGYQQSNNPDSPQTKGYQWRSLYRQDIQTVAVPIFTNKSFEQGAEFALTKALVNQIESRTPYKVSSRDRADTILEGEIVNVTTNTLSEGSANSLPQEQLMTFTVNFVWKNLKTGKVLAERRNFDQTAVFYPTLGEGRFTGSQQAVEKLAAAITSELQADW